MNDYPKFSVNGIVLSSAQNMTVWVALQSFGIEMEAPKALGDDEHGRAMAKGYLRRVLEINEIAHSTTT